MITPIKVLLVEDQQLVREGLKGLLGLSEDIQHRRRGERRCRGTGTDGALATGNADAAGRRCCPTCACPGSTAWA